MTDLTAVIHELIGLFDRFRLPYAIMGGIAVRAHGLPRPTFDVDFVFMQGQLEQALAEREG
jgi:hypothetical protein